MRQFQLLGQQARALDALGADPDPELLLRTAASVALGDPRFVRALARSLLERHPDEPLVQQRFPVVRRLRAARDTELPPQAHERLAEGLATALGFAFFGPWIAAALGEPVDPTPALERQLESAKQQLDESG